MLSRRGKTYYARVFVPKDMVGLIGRVELKKSLKTTDKREAKAAAAVLEHKAQTTFLRIRTGMLSERELERVTAGLIAEFTGRIDVHRKSYGTSSDFIQKGIPYGLDPNADLGRIETTFRFPKRITDCQQLADDYQKRIEWLEEQQATGLFSDYVRTLACRQIEENRLDVIVPPGEWFNINMDAWYTPPPSEFARVCLAVISGLVTGYRVEVERVLGRRDTPLQQETAAKVKMGKAKARLSDLWSVYRDKNRENWSESSLQRNTGLYAQIVDILGDVELSELEDERQAIKLREMLKLYPSSKEKKKAFAGRPFSADMAKHKDFKPLSIASQGKVIDLMSSMIKVAVRNRKKWGIDSNVFEGTQPNDNRPESSLRTEYQREEIQGLVEALKTIRVKWEPERFWVPLLALYTGARQGELCQLRTCDVTEVDGIPYIEICHKPELDQTTKTRRSRTCPIHRDLVDLGFLDYCRQQKHERLWPNLKLLNGRWQHEFSKWYCVTFRKNFCNPDDRKLDFHGLRHTFLNWFKQNSAVNFDTAKVLKSIAGHLDKFDEAIIGAVQKDMTFDRYGKEYTVKKQAELIALLDYNVDISQLKYKLKG
jgi:integrase